MCRCWRTRSRALLDVHPGELIVDCTFGAGGHSRLLARDLDGSGQLVAIDRDPTTQPFVDALRATVGTGVQVRPMHGPFASCLRRLLDEDAQAGAVLMDLGMSSMQVDAPARGFSYMHDAPLDMRMDPSDELTAATLVNEWDERELAQIFQRYGEERFSRQIARAIVQERAHEPFESTLQLVATIKRAIPTPSRFGHGHPAKHVFQALRIAVNDELGQLEDGLESALELCQPGGRLAVIAFHSLEDRMVKQRFVKAARGLHLPARPARLRLRPHAGVPARDQQGRAAGRRRGRGQSALGLGAPARRAAGGDGVSAVAAPRSATRARPVRRAPARVGVTSALLIVACAAVLIGIVTLQVSVLRLNSERGDLQAKRDQLISSNSELVGRLGGQLRAGRAGRQGEPSRGSCWRRSTLITTGSLGR